MPLVLGALGFFLGPLLHGLAVQSGDDSDLKVAPTCPRCGRDFRWLAWRCECGRLRWRELAAALVVGAGFAGFAAVIGVRPVLVAHLWMVAVTAVLIVTDLDHFRIPNSVLYPGTLGGLILLTVGAIMEGSSSALVRGLIGGAAYFGFLFVVFIVARGEGFGFGDVKLAFLLGLFAGFHGFLNLAWALIITALLGGVPALLLLAMGKGRKAAIPYGPPLVLGAWAAILFGSALIG